MALIPKSFTIEYETITDVLMSKCGVSKAFNPDEVDESPKIITCNAIWDTGASHSVISKSIVEELGLCPVGISKVYHADGFTFFPEYMVSFFLPNQVGALLLHVTEGNLADVSVLIGMDVISQGDFSITAPNGKTKFSFQLPLRMM
jgi:hypothetical protein